MHRIDGSPALAVLFTLLAACSFSFALNAADEAEPLIKALGSEKEGERTEAIAALLKMGPAARAALLTAEGAESVPPQQLTLIRRILGEGMINASPMKPVDLATVAPFGEDKAKGIRGDQDLLINKDTKLIVMNGEFILENGPLEYAIVSKHRDAKLHESVIGVYPRPRDICYALLACAYTYAGEMGEDGRVNLPKEAGVMISIEFDWETPHAKMGKPTETPEQAAAIAGPKRSVRIPLEFLIWNQQTKTTMKRLPFAFTGSRFEKGENGKMVFMADLEKSIVAIKTDPYAILNTLSDLKDVDPQHEAGCDVNRFTAPAKATKCRIVFEPWSGNDLKKEDLKDSNRPAAPAPKE